MVDFNSNTFNARTVIFMMGVVASGVWYSATVLNGINGKLERNHDEISQLKDSVNALDKSQADIARIKADRWNYPMQHEYSTQLQDLNPNLHVPNTQRIRDALNP